MMYIPIAHSIAINEQNPIDTYVPKPVYKYVVNPEITPFVSVTNLSARRNNTKETRLKINANAYEETCLSNKTTNPAPIKTNRIAKKAPQLNVNGQITPV